MKPKALIVGAGGVGKDLKFEKMNQHFDRITLDMDPNVKPDIVGDIREIPVDSESFEAVIASHVLEHVKARDVFTALGEFYRILKPGGELFISVPNLDLVCEKILSGKALEVVYAINDIGVTPFDILFGAGFVANELYEHKYGFNRETLFKWLEQFQWEGLFSYEHRMLGDYDRVEVRAYAMKPVDDEATDFPFQPYSNWMRKPDQDCGDPFILKGGKDVYRFSTKDI